MKKILMTLGACGLLMTGCVDLNQEPLSFPTPENINKTPENIESILNGLYRTLWNQNYGYNCRSQLLNLGSDDVMSATETKRGTQFDALYFTTGNMDDDTEVMWTNMYQLIQAANQWIEGIEAADNLTEEEKLRYVAECRFMRAFGHFTLVRYFGNVPGFTNSLCTTDAWGNSAITRNNIEDIYNDIIIPDLQNAWTYLPDRDDENNRVSGKNSRVNKWAAKACLIDVYRTMAGWPLKQTDKWQLARDEAYEFVTTSPYTLVEHYEDLWKEATKDDGTEHIFALNHSISQGGASQYGKSYWIEEERGWADYCADPVFYENYPDDERKDFNFKTTFTVAGSPRPLNYKQTIMKAPAIAKFRDYDANFDGNGVPSPQSNGITPIYRFAEVLLMYAEAQNELSGPDDLAYECLNRVRYRAAKDKENFVETSGLTKDQFRQAVFDEYGWELFSEFKRWFQLQRTEKIYDVNHGYTDAFGVQREANSRVAGELDRLGITSTDRSIYWYPLPSREVSDCGFEQNKKPY